MPFRQLAWWEVLSLIETANNGDLQSLDDREGCPLFIEEDQ